MKRAVIRITGRLLTDFFTVGKHNSVECVDGLPLGARFIGMAYDATYDVFNLVFEHESFKTVKPGELLPQIQPLYQGKFNA